jgi:hypothetical protein
LNKSGRLSDIVCFRIEDAISFSTIVAELSNNPMAVETSAAHKAANVIPAIQGNQGFSLSRPAG